MLNLVQIFLVFLSALTVVIADSIIKRVSSGSIIMTLKDPWMIIAYLLYFVQIVFAIYIFIYKGELAIYTNYYIIFYSVLGIIAGIVIFKENLNIIQGMGVILALIAAVLINHTS